MDSKKVQGVRLTKEELWPDKLPNAFLNRARETVQYLETQDFCGKTIVDCGEDNPLKTIIANTLGVYIYSVDWDFNEEHTIVPVLEPDVILCFEVLEHLYNPLLFLKTLKRMMKIGGVLYLSTPYQRPQILKAIHHYHEIPTDRLMWLFDAAGLKVEEMTKITIAGKWYNHLHGVRPMLRYWQKTRLYKLVSLPN